MIKKIVVSPEDSPKVIAFFEELTKKKDELRKKVERLIMERGWFRKQK